MQVIYVMENKKQKNLISFIVASSLVLTFWILIATDAEGIPDWVKNKYTFSYSLIVFFVIVSSAIMYYFRKRIEINIEEGSGSFKLEINDPSFHTPLIIRSPFKWKKQGVVEPQENGKPKLHLYLTACNSSGSPLVTFVGTMDFSFYIPEDLEYIEQKNTSSKTNPLIAEEFYHLRSKNISDLLKLR